MKYKYKVKEARRIFKNSCDRCYTLKEYNYCAYLAPKHAMDTCYFLAVVSIAFGVKPSDVFDEKLRRKLAFRLI